MRDHSDSEEWVVRTVCGGKVETWEIDDTSLEIKFLVTPTPDLTSTLAATSSPDRTSTLGSARTFDPPAALVLTPNLEPTEIPAPNFNRSTIDELLSGYIGQISLGFDCLSVAGLGLDLKENIDVSFSADKWTVNSSGPGCRGTIQTWIINDMTGEIEYLGVQ